MPTYTTKPITYTVNLSNGGGTLDINLTLNKLDEDTAKKVFVDARNAFRDAQVINDETGQVMAHYYYDEDWFEPILPIEFAIRNIRKIIEKEQAL